MGIQRTIRANPSYNFRLTGAEHRQLAPVNGRGLNSRGSLKRLVAVMRPIAARVFGLDLASSSLESSLFCWAKKVMREHREPAGEAYRLLDLRSSVTQELVWYLFVPMTSFFRDRHQYATLCHVLDEIYSNVRNSSPVRIWVPGCSRGDEAYTIAMVVKKKGFDETTKTNIIGSDVDQQQLMSARAGQYTFLDNRDKDIDFGTDELIEEHAEFFYDAGDVTNVRQDIKRMVEFRLDNLLRTEVQGHFDLVSEHHLLMYLEREPRQVAARKIVERVSVGGFVMSNDFDFAQFDNMELVPETQEHSYRAFRKVS